MTTKQMCRTGNLTELAAGVRTVLATHASWSDTAQLVADQLRTHRKTATIRLGDKSGKYKKGMIVTVLVGVRYGQREKIFDAVIDKVEVKRISELSPREIEHDNPEIRRPDEMTRFLGSLYNREVTEDETVTVIRFSQIIGSMF